MLLIVARHGETVENFSRVVQGQLPGVLSEIGCAQARAAGLMLSSYDLDAVYSSDLTRAWDTARIISDFHPGKEVISEPRLREQHLGDLQGKPLYALMRSLKKNGTEMTSFDPDGGETSAKFRSRVAGVIGDLAVRHTGQTVLLVTHYGFIGMFLSIFADKAALTQTKEMTRNCAVTFAEFDGTMIRDIYYVDYAGDVAGR